MNIAVITTFPNWSYEVYAKHMISSFIKFWPKDVSLLVQLDDDLLQRKIEQNIRATDAVAVGWTQDHLDFVIRHKDKDDKDNYRKQVTRFCHKVFAIKRALQAIKEQKARGGDCPRYLIWMDADVVTEAPVTIDTLKKCLPKDGEAVSYLGRKDWPHSECGWMAFDLENKGDDIIDVMHGLYVSDEILKLKEWHDSWVFDHVINSKEAPKATNLTEGKPGMDIWPHSPMGQWSKHYKGPVAKNNLAPQPVETQIGQKPNFVIQTKNSIPDEEIHKHIVENQSLIKNWIRRCDDNDEEIVVVSAGPQFYPEDVMDDFKKGKKIVAVKHALERLEAAGIRPWACILLDPRPHVYNFVMEPDPEIIWFVASQVDPKVTSRLLAKGCTVWGYHASVGANEGHLTEKQADSVVGGGSATATRGLFILRHLGFKKFKLFGYDLCFPDKPDLNAIDDQKQPKFLEISLGWNDPLSSLKKCFWTTPELVAQFEEMNQLIQNNTFEIDAYGDGIIPFIVKAKNAGKLRRDKLRAKMGLGKPVSYRKLLKWNSQKKTNSLMQKLKNLLNSH